MCLAALAAMFASLYPSLLQDQNAIVQMATTMSNPAMVAMMGPVYGMESLTQAIAMSQECLVWFLISSAIMNIFLVNRHTRVDEELGRLEMFRAMPVGKLTGNLATIEFALYTNILISVLTALLLMAVNIGGTTAAGAFAYGFSVGAVGFLFAGLTLLAAQLFSTAHGVSGFGFAVLGLFYVMRALGDVGNNVLSSISPFGLGLKVEAFYSNKFTPVLILLIEAVVLTAIALIIGIYRDHGAGVIPARKGRANASLFLRSPLGYAWRVSRPIALGWAAGLLLLGVSYGSVCTNITDFVEGSDMMKRILGAGGANTLLDNYVAMIYSIMSMVVCVPAVLTALKIYGEEKRGRLEQIYARSVCRVRLFLCFIAIAIVESVILELLLTFGLSAASGGALPFESLFNVGFSYLPAIWSMIGLAVLLAGLLHKLTNFIWIMFGYTFFVMYFGRIMDVPKWVTRITPFGNIPQLPVQDFTLMPLVVLTIIAAALAVTGILCYRERDIG